ncbi:TIGR03085 family metal-binding protein [Arthrobacter sp. A2-55]|uniref:TIGR03085 family metal-binding protein n=1 Tax=Arthrobacter sp. A2-55 TaxID=2897337 RepID=UPI0021CDD1C9|nr:TIGR03085 family metal-binding protein [Arthrobacter sp. A2-55]MCU6478880.1 TIGR03085 family metal-binding protein [Arthrobacter sp. A2-55]
METERLALVATFRQADPDAPTLCEGWTVRTLLGHLVQREHNPWARMLDTTARPVPGQERRLGALVATARTAAGYEALVQQFAAGTGPLNPMTWLGDGGQLLEYVVHHEDVRRGTGNKDPRTLPAGQLDALWKNLPLMARFTYRRCPVGVSIASPGRGTTAVHKAPSGSRPAAVVLAGDPVEVALCVSGRQRAANIEVTGSPENTAAFQAWAAGK